MTMNSPESLAQLYNLATSQSKDKAQSVQTAELMREVGLKCIGFNGVPRTINCLGAFRASLPSEIVSSLSTKPTRYAQTTKYLIHHYLVKPSPEIISKWSFITRLLTDIRVPTTQNIDSIITRGNNLWKSIYAPFSDKLVSKLSDSHPDLPVHILNHEYGGLFADPESLPQGAKVGRVLTSIVAVSCLRAQTGVGPQVTSHIFGLRKALEDGSATAPGEVKLEGAEWLASEEGNKWILDSVDSIVEALGQGKGSSFAPGIERSKL